MVDTIKKENRRIVAEDERLKEHLEDERDKEELREENETLREQLNDALAMLESK